MAKSVFQIDLKEENWFEFFAQKVMTYEFLKLIFGAKIVTFHIFEFLAPKISPLFFAKKKWVN